MLCFTAHSNAMLFPILKPSGANKTRASNQNSKNGRLNAGRERRQFPAGESGPAPAVIVAGASRPELTER